jgi:SAM-dependent methyltransferase
VNESGLVCHATSDLDSLPPSRFDVITLFNVLDRCARPHSLLRSIKRRLNGPGARLVVACPLPFRPAVERGAGWVDPREALLSADRCLCAECAPWAGWEQRCEALLNVFQCHGFKVLAFARAPYISAGDAWAPWYVLDDVICVLSTDPAWPGMRAPLNERMPVQHARKPPPTTTPHTPSEERVTETAAPAEGRSEALLQLTANQWVWGLGDACDVCQGRFPILEYYVPPGIFAKALPRRARRAGHDPDADAERLRTLGTRFVQVPVDRPTVDFMQECFRLLDDEAHMSRFEKSAQLQREGLPHTTIMALCDTYFMHLLSGAQLAHILDRQPSNNVTFAGSYPAPRGPLPPGLSLQATVCSCGDAVFPAHAHDGDKKEEKQEAVLSSAFLASLRAKQQQAGLGSALAYLDVGCGSGRVTAMLAPLFDSCLCTEADPAMSKKPALRGLTCVNTRDVDSLPSELRFDLVSLLNVLDRCALPHTLLRQLYRRLRNADSRLIVACPLPFHQAVEQGGEWISARERITEACFCEDCAPQTPLWSMWLQGLSSLQHMFESAGFKVEAWGRIPYLSQGDTYSDYYYLDDAIFVLSKGAECES